MAHCSQDCNDSDFFMFFLFFVFIMFFFSQAYLFFAYSQPPPPMESRQPACNPYRYAVVHA